MKKFLYLLIFLTGTYCSAMNRNPPLKKIIIAGKVLNPDPDIFNIDVVANANWIVHAERIKLSQIY